MFKKSLSMILTLLMVFSCMGTMIFTASAGDYTPEGTPITQENWSTIANNLSGKYYLTEDITISATVAGNFAGTLDGKDTNGVVHKITTTAPIFNNLAPGATIQNLEIYGNISKNAWIGALAVATTSSATGQVTLSNITNNANCTTTAGNVGVAGFIGQVSCPVVFASCPSQTISKVTFWFTFCFINAEFTSLNSILPVSLS